MRSEIRTQTTEIAVIKSKLRFLGQEYFPNNTFVETIPSDIMVRFRGQSYSLPRPFQSINPEFGMRKYRGVLYTKGS